MWFQKRLENLLFSLFASHEVKLSHQVRALKTDKVIIYGAGEVGMRLVPLLDELGISTTCIIDKNAESAPYTLWPNIPVVGPSSLHKLHNEVIIITVVQFRKEVMRILKSLPNAKSLRVI